MQKIEIFRGNNLLVEIKPDDSSVQSKAIMGENVLRLNFKLNHHVGFTIGDYCTVFEEIYKLNQLPVINKKSTYLYEYTLVMESMDYEMMKVQYLFLGANNTLRETDFHLTGTADTFLNLCISNLNRVSPGWIKGQVIPSNYRTISFERSDCYSALNKISAEFETEFWLQGKTIHLAKRRKDTGYSFRHGEAKGLYEVIRETIDNSTVVTRLYAYGSTKNLPSNYNNFTKRLQLPPDPTPSGYVTKLTCTVIDNGNGTQTITFNFTNPVGAAALMIEYRIAGSNAAWASNTGVPTSPRVITVPVGSYEVRFKSLGPPDLLTDTIIVSGSITTAVLKNHPIPYIEANVATFGIIEHTEIFDDIFPRRTGTLTSVNAANIFQFIDANINFNVNDQSLPGLTAKVTFNTGQLTGYSFKIKSFNNGTKLFEILKNDEETSLDIPNVNMKPAIGDKYVLTDIKMPQSYIDAAEMELQARAQARLIELSVPQVSYRVEIDPVFMKTKNWKLTIGDEVWLIDTELAIQKKIRVVKTTRNIVNEYDYKIDLSDIVSPGTISKIISAQANTAIGLNSLNQSYQNNSILNNNVIGDLKFVGDSTAVFQNIPTTNNTNNHSLIYIDNQTGKLVRKV